MEPAASPRVRTAVCGAWLATSTTSFEERCYWTGACDLFKSLSDRCVGLEGACSEMHSVCEDRRRSGWSGAEDRNGHVMHHVSLAKRYQSLHRFKNSKILRIIKNEVSIKLYKSSRNPNFIEIYKNYKNYKLLRIDVNVDHRSMQHASVCMFRIRYSHAIIDE